MADPLITRKLEGFTRLSPDDRAALDRVSQRVRTVEARRDLISEGVKPTHVHLICSGWASAYKTLPDGKKQVVGIFLPGDFCDLDATVLKAMDHSIAGITRVKVAEIATADMRTLTEAHPRIAQALLWDQLVTVATQREWLLNIGQRSAHQRLAHLFIELYLRLHAVGQTNNGNCDFPLTQTDLAEATGLTSVHVNRMLQELRAAGLIALEHKRLSILDVEQLMSVSSFNVNYLHLDRAGAYLDSHE